FRIAYQIPNLFRRLFGEGALSAALIPALTDCLRERGEAEGRRLGGAVLALVAALLTAVAVVVAGGAFVADMFHPAPVLRLTGVLIFYMPLVCAAALAGAILNVLGRFAAPAFAPVLLNLFIIASAGVGGWGLGLGDRDLLYVISGGVLCGGVAQVVMLLGVLRRAGFRPQYSLAWRHPEVRKIAALMAPTIVGMSAVQINTLADSLIALWFVPDGRGPAILGYAQYFYHLPLGVMGIALATAIFPLLSARASAGDMAGLSRACAQGVRMSLFIGVPSAVGLCLVASPLIQAFFQRGQFDSADTVRAVRALVFYSAGVWAYFLQHILVRTLYALKDSRTPARVGVVIVLFNLVLNLILVRRMGEAGVALATGVCAVLQAGWLMVILSRRLPLLGGRWILSGVWRIVVSTGVLVVAVLLPSWLIGPERWEGFHPGVQVAGCVVAGAIAYAGSARLLGLVELGDLLASRRRR
ncbi:MAG: murein biosynthesis integral membrane protein MurJ, partial [bacterium]|nr:murein biosynthesis integral membrane protein MurJ [bacterium]